MRNKAGDQGCERMQVLGGELPPVIQECHNDVWHAVCVQSCVCTVYRWLLVRSVESSCRIGPDCCTRLLPSSLALISFQRLTMLKLLSFRFLPLPLLTLNLLSPS